jgi:hypothetical protein
MKLNRMVSVHKVEFAIRRLSACQYLERFAVSSLGIFQNPLSYLLSVTELALIIDF